MAHYAEINPTPTTQGGVVCHEVLRVIVVGNDNEGPSEDPYEQEIAGLAWLAAFAPTAGKTFVKTSYTASFRKHYAGLGFFYSSAVDGFFSPCPGPGWILNEDTCEWVQTP